MRRKLAEEERTGRILIVPPDDSNDTMGPEEQSQKEMWASRRRRRSTFTADTSRYRQNRKNPFARAPLKHSSPVRKRKDSFELLLEKHRSSDPDTGGAQEEGGGGAKQQRPATLPEEDEDEDEEEKEDESQEDLDEGLKKILGNDGNRLQLEDLDGSGLEYEMVVEQEDKGAPARGKPSELLAPPRRSLRYRLSFNGGQKQFILLEGEGSPQKPGSRTSATIQLPMDKKQRVTIAVPTGQFQPQTSANSNTHTHAEKEKEQAKEASRP